MAGRALVFSHPDLIKLIRDKFIPYAGDQWYLHRRDDPEGAFFWKVVEQGIHRDMPRENTRQGLYAATAAGHHLGSNNSWSPEKTIQMLQGALERWRRDPSCSDAAEAVNQAEISAASSDPQYFREPPAGGLILNVYCRLPLPASDGFNPNNAIGRDHLWLTRDEWQSLLPASWMPGLRYPMPAGIADRIARFHLVDNVRGEPNMWTGEDIRELDLHLTVMNEHGSLAMDGAARMERDDVRGCQVRLQGYLTYDIAGKNFSRFDILAWGEAWGEGTYTGGAPPGRFALLIAMSLAGDTPADRVPPQGSRGLAGYFGTLPEPSEPRARMR